MKIIIDKDRMESILIKEDFTDNRRGWEELDTKKEYALIRDNHYLLENRAENRWNYYKTEASLEPGLDFGLEAEIEMLQYESACHAGLLWGFDKKIGFVNRFTVSADGTRATIGCFEKDHRRTIYRFHARIGQELNTEKKFRLKVERSAPFYLFYLNGELLNILHEFHLKEPTRYFGYYIEPKLRIRSDHFELKAFH